MDHQTLLNLWLEKANEDPDLIAELRQIENDPDEIADRFWRNLEFGTGGLRGVIGAGTNRMNIYTVARATQGLADYINNTAKNPSVAISFDSRIKSDLFARVAAEVFAANGIRVHIYKQLLPTPMLSFAVRALSCSAGIMVTASHNPSKYNGYKAYGPDGCQLTLEASEAVLDLVDTTDTFEDVKRVPFDEAQKDGRITYIGDEVTEAYLKEVEGQAVHSSIPAKKDLKVVYTPLYGTGNLPVRAILKRTGIENVTVVSEQELPNGNFPTCPFPNPEIKEAFAEAIKLGEELHPDLLLATDPDCDRVGIAVVHGGEYCLMSGNEVGALLTNYILSGRKQNGTLPKDPILVKTIVTTELAAKIAAKYGCKTVDVLTGFKFIGEQIALLEEKGQEDRYILGFEESYGYLSGSYVRDKDAVVASMLICEMAAYYKEMGKDLLDVMNELYEEFGYHYQTQLNITCEGITGMKRMGEMMEGLIQTPPKTIGGLGVTAISDYNASKHTDLASGQTTDIDLPASNVVGFDLERQSKVIVRPSGTEPKIKIYITAVGSREESIALGEKIEEDMKKILK